MKNLKKKGFTIVELVIVIAVIAILSAVLIPTFSNLIRKANVSADTQLVKQLNQALAVEEVENGKNVTMYDALETVKEYGFDVTKINAKANLNEILWDSKNNIFVYYNDETKKIEYIPNSEPVEKGEGADLWKVYNDEDDTPAKDAQVYSIYWNKTSAFVGEVVVGFDAGNTVANEVTYTGTADATLRTNGGIVKVNAPEATVNHYGLADEVYVGQVSENTYNLFGDVAYMEVAADQHVVLKEGSSVSGIYAETGANVELNNGQSEEVISDDKEAIKAAATMFAGGLGTAEKPYLIATVEHMQNISSLYNEYKYYKVKDGVIELDCSNWISINLNGSFDGNNVKFVNIDSRLFNSIGSRSSNDWSKNVYVKNIDATFKLEGNLDAAGGFSKQIIGFNTTTLENILIGGQIVAGSNSGGLFSYTTGNIGSNTTESVVQTINVVDCVVSATIVCTSGSFGVVAGHPGAFWSNKYPNGQLNINVNNPEAIWKGKVSLTSGSKAMLFGVSGPYKSENSTENKEFTNGINKVSTVNPVKGEDGNYYLTTANSTKRVELYISAQLTETDEEGNITSQNGITMPIEHIGTIEIDQAGSDILLLSKIEEFSFIPKQESYNAVYENGKLSVTTGGSYNYTFGHIDLTICEYDSLGSVTNWGKIILVNNDNINGWVIK